MELYVAPVIRRRRCGGDLDRGGSEGGFNLIGRRDNSIYLPAVGGGSKISKKLGDI